MKINFGRLAFLLCNFVFLLSGICLVLLGCVLLNDTPRILLSQLFLEPGMISRPLLYYIAVALITTGLVVFLVSLLGCWVSWDPNSNWLMGFYLFLLIVLLLTETSLGAVAALCPHIIGVTIDRDQMVAGLMNNYGVPGRSQYTAAVDLAQTLLECCGMQSGSDYDGSRWWKREQETKHDLRVPHSCCFLMNTDDEASFLNPKPLNSSLCQAKTNSRYQHGRHVKGCIDKLNEWFKDHVTIFLTVGLALVVVQLSVLLCALLVCARRRKQVNVMASTTGITTSKSFKRHKRSEKNQTPRPERKSAAVQIHTIENNGFASQRKTYKTDSDILQNSLKPVNGTPKKLNEDFGDVRGKDSLSSLPLVLRNEHFHRFEESKPKLKFNSNSIRKNSSAAVNYNHHNETPSVYFTPHYYSHERNRDFYNDTEGYKQNEDVKSYFCKNEKYGIENSMYETCKDT